MVEMRAGAARAEGMPLVIVMASTGSDIVEGIAALEGWGRLARALVDCSGIVPTIIVVDGPAVSGPALLLGVADLVVMTETSYAFVNGPVMVEEFTGVRISDRRARRRRRAGPAHRRAEPRRRRPRGRHRRRRRAARLPALERRRRAAPLADRRPRRPAVPRGRGADPDDVDGQLRRPPGRGRDRRRPTAARDPRPVGRQRRHGASPRSTASRSASSPTSRSRWPARSTSRRHRRRPASSPSATPSTCRSSRSSTRPASIPARTSSGGA